MHHLTHNTDHETALARLADDGCPHVGGRRLSAAEVAALLVRTQTHRLRGGGRQVSEDARAIVLFWQTVAAAHLDRPLSLDAPLGHDPDAGTIGETLAARPAPEQPPEFVPNFWDVVAGVAELTDPERIAVEMRYRRDAGFQEIGQEVGMNTPRARALVNASLNKIRTVADRLLPLVLAEQE